jgi:Rrf2 family iron-sulfur cluster assembly transcriptional regulator
MQISRAGDYALRSVVYLSRQSDDRLCTIGEIAHAQQIPQAFLAKLMPMLIKAKVLDSVQGPKGGYRLSRPASEINFLEVIQAIDGPITLVLCQDKESCCEIEEFCSMNEVFSLAKKRLTDFFREATFADLPVMMEKELKDEHIHRGLTQLTVAPENDGVKPLLKYTKSNKGEPLNV